MTLSWTNALFALGLGLFVGLVILAAGLWMDRARERRWQRELEGIEQASSSAAEGLRSMAREASRIRFPKGLRTPEQRKDDVDGA